MFSFLTLIAGEIKVAVAANVSYAIEPLKEIFAKSHPHTKVTILLGSSGKLTAQISNGAPFDLFLSANMKYPRALYTKQLAMTKPVVYAEGALAMLSTKARDFKKGLSLITDTKVKRIAIANPKTAPYGEATMEVFNKTGLFYLIKPKLIYAESIAQTVQYTMVAADIGFIAAASLHSNKMKHFKKDQHYHLVDTALYTPIEQGIVLLSHARDNSEARTFYDFILSDSAKSVFEKYGYLVR